MEDAPNMEAGIYLLQQSNLNEEIIKFITLFKREPFHSTKNNVIIQIKFEKGFINSKDKKEYVIICCDATHGERFTYNQLKNVAHLIIILISN